MEEKNKIVVGIVNKNNQLLLIRRKKVEGLLEWSFPSGKVEHNETLEQACVREIFEETGIKSKIIKLLGSRIHPNTGKHLTYYICSYVSGEIGGFNSTEIENALFVNYNEIYDYITSDLYEPVKKIY